MKKYLLLLLISFTFFHNYTIACTCGLSSFCESIIGVDGNYYADIILRGTITDNAPDGIDVQIDQLLYGNYAESELTFVRSFCDIYLDPLEVDKEYVFALRKNINDKFALIICSISYLPIENEVVKGRIAPDIESIDYDDFLNLEGCSENFFHIEKSLSIFPNPTVDVLKIKNIGTIGSIANVRIEFIDMIGRQLFTFKKEDEIVAGEIWTINLENFAAGVYFLKLTANNQEDVIRIVKQ